MLPEDRNIPTVNTLTGPVARGSVLHKKLQGFQMASTNPVTSCDPIPSQSPNPAVNGSSNESGHVPTQTNSNVTDSHFTNHYENSTDSQPKHTPIAPSVSTTVPPAKVLLIFLYYPTNVVRTPLTWIHFLMLQTSWIRFRYPFKHNKSFMPRQLVKQITVYGMMRENTTSHRKCLANF